jgi:outer membrane protein TolC
MTRFLLAAASTLALAACTSGRDYAAPAPSQIAAGAFISTNTPGVTIAPVERDWWRLYRDPSARRPRRRRACRNTDLRVAVARLARARAALREVRAERGPQAGLGANAQYGPRTARAGLRPAPTAKV